MTLAVPRLSFAHLLSLSDEVGTFEHADHLVARRHHGYCTDDMARVLVVVVREPDPSPAVVALGATARRFLLAAQAADGTIRNRRVVGGDWSDLPGVEDCWGRALWAFGSMARLGRTAADRARALAAFERSAVHRSPYNRSMAFAALGAAEVVAIHAAHGAARALLGDAVTVIGQVPHDPSWPWPEPRLTYANAVLAEALMAAGAVLERATVLDDGLRMLDWLLERETSASGCCSPTPVGGAGPEDAGPRFDQQPIEVAAMADACARAFALTADGRWRQGLDATIDWFAGANDAATPMWDPTSGGGFDGLRADGANLNQGTESTLALLSTLQHARRPVAALA